MYKSVNINRDNAEKNLLKNSDKQEERIGELEKLKQTDFNKELTELLRTINDTKTVNVTSYMFTTTVNYGDTKYTVNMEVIPYNGQ